jgi:2-dehydro-3-deoxyglucarate aldolase
MDRLAALGHIRTRLRQGETVVGGWMQIPHASIAEIMGEAGYDWIALDLEHGAIAVNQLPDLFRALELGNALGLARVAQGQPQECKQALDSGAAGVIVPMIESAQQLSAVASACRWPPAGERGVGFSRANLFGARFETYAAEAQAPFLVAMIEHVRAVQELPRILAVAGLDAILIGPYDLSASMGITGQFEEPEFVIVMTEIRHLAQRAQVPFGVHVVKPEPSVLRARVEEGCRFLAYGTDAQFLMRGARRDK